MKVCESNSHKLYSSLKKKKQKLKDRNHATLKGRVAVIRSQPHHHQDWPQMPPRPLQALCQRSATSAADPRTPSHQDSNLPRRGLLWVLECSPPPASPPCHSRAQRTLPMSLKLHPLPAKPAALPGPAHPAGEPTALPRPASPQYCPRPCASCQRASDQ